MDSCLYFGKVSHHRKSPKVHNLSYKMFMAHLFLDELNKIFEIVGSGLSINQTCAVFKDPITIGRKLNLGTGSG